MAAAHHRDRRAHPHLVYIQFRGTVTREEAEAFRSRLGELGYNAPGTERLEADFRSWVRYFHDEDRPAADSVAAAAARFFGERGRRIEFTVQNLAGRGFRAQHGQIEVWISR